MPDATNRVPTDLTDNSCLKSLLDVARSDRYTRHMDEADISLLYQDHHLLIVNKPAGIVIHPTYKHANGTFWDALLLYLEQQGTVDNWQPPQLADEPGWERAPLPVREMLRQQRTERLWREEGLLARPCLLHRLDKDTSGVVALARTAKARGHLARQFHQHTIDKRYLAVVSKGAPEWTRPRAPLHVTLETEGARLDSAALERLEPGWTLLLDGPLWRDPLDRRRCIVIENGQEAQTRVSVRAVAREYALLEVSPITGRTHQIRAHLAALGFAIVGDPLYALPGPHPFARQFLHAHRLDLHRYPDNTLCSFTAPLSADLADWLKSYCPEFLHEVAHT